MIHNGKSSAVMENVCEETQTALSSEEYTPPPLNKFVTVLQIMQATAAVAGLSVDQITGRDRTRYIVHHRQLAAYLSKHWSNKSFPTIGVRFGRDHSTIMHSVTETQKRLDDPLRHGLRETVRLIHARLLALTIVPLRIVDDTQAP